MHRGIRIVFVAATAVGAVAMAAAPGVAGTVVGPHNTVTIVKQVVGTAPAGTTFTVQVDCENGLGAGASDIPTVTFDATGNPTTSAVFTPGPTSTCTVTEIANGGAATVAYGCVSAGNSDSDKPGDLVQCTADNAVHFTDVIGDSATITVTNTFVDPTPPPAPPVAQAVAVAPAFTG